MRHKSAYREAFKIYRQRKKHEELVIWHNSSKDQDYESHNLRELEEAKLMILI